jgi:hypothetical protein
MSSNQVHLDLNQPANLSAVARWQSTPRIVEVISQQAQH